MMNEDEDDPIVYEVPVFMTNALSKQLYLFQYPLRPATSEWNDSSSKVISSKIRISQKKVELTRSLDSNSTANFDASKSQKLAGGRIDSVKFESTLFNTDIGQYAVGVFDANELHLTPLSGGILSMRPQLDYLDHSSEEGATSSTNKRDDEEDEDSGPTLQAVKVKFLRGNLDKDRSFREKSFQSLQRRAEEEAWITTEYFHFDQNSERWKDESSKMFCKKMDQEIKFFDKESEYYQSLR